MNEQKKVGHAQHLKAVNHPIRREMLRIIFNSEQISEESLLEILDERNAVKDVNIFKYNMDFLIQALCVEKIESKDKIYYKILPGGRVIENF